MELYPHYIYQIE